MESARGGAGLGTMLRSAGPLPQVRHSRTPHRPERWQVWCPPGGGAGLGTMSRSAGPLPQVRHSRTPHRLER